MIASPATEEEHAHHDFVIKQGSPAHEWLGVDGFESQMVSLITVPPHLSADQAQAGSGDSAEKTSAVIEHKNVFQEQSQQEFNGSGTLLSAGMLLLIGSLKEVGREMVIT